MSKEKNPKAQNLIWICIKVGCSLCKLILTSWTLKSSAGLDNHLLWKKMSCSYEVINGFTTVFKSKTPYSLALMHATAQVPWAQVFRSCHRVFPCDLFSSRAEHPTPAGTVTESCWGQVTGKVSSCWLEAESPEKEGTSKNVALVLVFFHLSSRDALDAWGVHVNDWINSVETDRNWISWRQSAM